MEIAPVFNAQTIALVSNDPLWFVMEADANLKVFVRLLHKDPPSTTWVDLLAPPDANQGSPRSLIVNINHPANALHGDSIGWIIACASLTPATAGTFPVKVQLFQGPNAATRQRLTNIARYELALSAAQITGIISDAIRVQ